MLLANTLYVGTDISEKANRSRFYDASGDEIGGRVETANDLPGSKDLASKALLGPSRLTPPRSCGASKPPTSSGGTWPRF